MSPIDEPQGFSAADREVDAALGHKEVRDVPIPPFMEPLDGAPPAPSKAEARIAALGESARNLTAQLGQVRFNFLIAKAQHDEAEARLMAELQKHGTAIAELKVAT